ncbi:hypothetical protein NQ317_000501 [Molorchus minor]|uniref:Tyr recombinase domain-containing protein n=1 Tax=Molorchus minor TaxID=1323400 RepID=A0ABQ9IQZ3_9CUCU|nr:hypothetical protein NQ317_000501 [Molorchus minor]
MDEIPSENFARPDFHTPSLALKIGYNLKKCISIERGSALRAGNLKRNRELLSTLHLMKMEWEIRILSNALSSLYRRKINSVQLLPLTNDLVKLSNHLDSQLTIAKADLIKDKTNIAWTRLATLALARIILFNKRRSGEAAKMKMSNYISRVDWRDQNTIELQESLTPFEKQLANSLIVVEIEGKRGRKVPVILTPTLKESVDLLIRHRDECNIYYRNKYVFARSNKSLLFLRGHDCLNKICNEISLENPSIITGTRLRKYVATVCQLFNMTENQYDWLARHLGHDIRVHRDFYRMHESAIELTKVSRLLLAVDKGEVNKFAGRNLEDIEIKDLPQLDYEDEDDNNDIEEKEDDNNIEESKETEIDNVPTIESKSNGTKKKIKGNNKATPVPWTSNEKKAVFNFFQVNIKRKVLCQVKLNVKNALMKMKYYVIGIGKKINSVLKMKSAK